MHHNISQCFIIFRAYSKVNSCVYFMWPFICLRSDVFVGVFVALSDLHNSFRESGAETTQTERAISGCSSYLVNSPRSLAFEFEWPVSLATLHFRFLISCLSERRDYIVPHAVAFWSIWNENEQAAERRRAGGSKYDPRWLVCIKELRNVFQEAKASTEQSCKFDSTKELHCRAVTHTHTKVQAQIFLWKWSMVLQSVRMVTA